MMERKPIRKLFISYSFFDEDKVKLIKNELKKHVWAQAIVIASDRDALKPLAEKVMEGLRNADIVIPILTEKSIKTQWINQEIGFATAKDIKVIPIVDIGIIDHLKGFIHKQIDLPYLYAASSKKGQDNKNFINSFRTLISDLEKLNETITAIEPELNFEQKAENLLRKRKFKEREQAFLSDYNSSEYVNRQFLDFKDILEEKNNFLSTKEFHLSSHFYPIHPFLVFRSDSNSVIIYWSRPSPNNIVGNVLSVELWHGLLSLRTINPRSDFDSGVKSPRVFAAYKYTYTINEDGMSGWKGLSDNEFYDNERIINSTIEWLLDRG